VAEESGACLSAPPAAACCGIIGSGDGATMKKVFIEGDLVIEGDLKEKALLESVGIGCALAELWIASAKTSRGCKIRQAILNPDMELSPLNSCS